MKAILCSQYCGPDDLVLADIPDPVAGPGEAVIAIKAAALNFFDLLMIQGKYQHKPPLPFIPGMEGAGEVISVGEGVTEWKPGDRVVGGLRTGGFAEEAVADARALRRIPEGMDFIAASAFQHIIATEAGEGIGSVAAIHVIGKFATCR